MNFHRPWLATTFVLLLASSCVSDDQWSFAATRSFYGNEKNLECMGAALGDSANANEGAAIAAGALLLLPSILDVIALPIALPRDLWVHFGPQ